MFTWGPVVCTHAIRKRGAAFFALECSGLGAVRVALETPRKATEAMIPAAETTRSPRQGPALVTPSPNLRRACLRSVSGSIPCYARDS